MSTLVGKNEIVKVLNTPNLIQKTILFNQYSIIISNQ